MRYIGSKENLLGLIDRTVSEHGIAGGVFCDLFAGTTVVGRHFKRQGYRVISNDLMEYSYVFGKAYIENNAEVDRLEQLLAYLNSLPPVRDFMFDNYSDEGTASAEFRRMYFSAANAGKIDAIRCRIAGWARERAVSEAGCYVLLASLLEAVPGVSNTTGTYGAFLKYWEARSQKPLTLTLPPLVCSEGRHEVHRRDANALAREIECDVLYLDPPYNSRQYATNYHILETVALWDYPAVYGKSGLRPYQGEKSAYCRTDGALAALRDLVGDARCRLLLLSYNSEGIMPHEAICDILAQRGSLTVTEQTYRRYRSDSDHSKRRYRAGGEVVERVYALSMG
ncbi:MAG: DNA adenine methylase [Chloroflexia bacterium]